MRETYLMQLGLFADMQHQRTGVRPTSVTIKPVIWEILGRPEIAAGMRLIVSEESPMPVLSHRLPDLKEAGG